MSDSKGYGYSNPELNEMGTIRIHSTNLEIKVPAEAYERAYVIHEAKRAMEDWSIEEVYKVKMTMFDLMK